MKNKNGTVIKPPPIPNRPAKNPTAVAAKIINNKKCQYSLIRKDKDRYTYFLSYSKIFKKGSNRY